VGMQRAWNPPCQVEFAGRSRVGLRDTEQRRVERWLLIGGQAADQNEFGPWLLSWPELERLDQS
jgi:hypothetical protein